MAGFPHKSVSFEVIFPHKSVAFVSGFPHKNVVFVVLFPQKCVFLQSDIESKAHGKNYLYSTLGVEEQNRP